MDNKQKANPLITLAVIVGKEEAVMERFIRSFADAVDHMVFCQAIGKQDPDNSIEIAAMTCEELGIPATFLQYHNKADFPHVDDFGAARQMAWKVASETKADYLMWADCDDTLAEGSAETISMAATEAKHDIYVIPYRVKGDIHVAQEVMRERLVRNDGKTEWRFPIHEQLKFLENRSYGLLRGAMFHHSPHHTKTGSHQRNVNILLAAVEDTARNYFYLHQEFFNVNEFKKARQCAKLALEAPGLETLERYETLLNLAQMEDSAKAKEHAALAFELMPERREALALLINYAILERNHEKALLLARIMMGLGKPKRSYWSLNHTWYSWKGSELYMQCLRLAGGNLEEFENLYRNNQPPLFSIIHATLGRPQKALAIRETWLSRARWPERVEYIFGLHEGDDDSLRVLKGFQHTIAPKGCGCPINYDTAAGAARGEILIQAQDDCYPPPGWDEILLNRIKDFTKPAFVAVGDGHRNDRLCVNTIMTKAYADIKKAQDPDCNGFFPRAYNAVFADTENTYRAYKDAEASVCELIEARDVIIYHDHPTFNQSVPWDATYEQENSTDAYKHNGAVFNARNPHAATDNVLNLPPNACK
jgi:hypothetical protein